ncbi:phosphate ABC transporter permease, partial [filamentous cyanobacterium CCP5]
AAVLGVIGAGGLGYEILLSLQSLRYEQLWTGFYALVVLNGGVDAGSAWLRRRLGLMSRLDLNARRSPQASTVSLAQPSPWLLRIALLAIAVVIPLCFWSLGITWSQIWAERAQRLLAEVIQAAVPSGFTLAAAIALLNLSLVTVAMAIVAMVLAGIAGIGFSFLAAQNICLPGGLLQPQGRGPFLRGLWLLSRLLLLFSRAIPAPIWALVCLFVLFPGILPGALALAIHNFGILGRLMAEVNENLDERPVRALRSLGASGPQMIAYGILPQNLSRFLAYILYRWEVCTRETVIVGLVGAGGLGRLLTEQISSFDYGGVTLTLAAFVVLTFAVDMVSHRLRSTLR